MTRDKAREHFENSGLKYSDISVSDIHTLTDLINKHLKVRNKNFKDTAMRLSKKIKIKFTEEAKMFECYLFLNSHYFTRREAISFNKDGFIGFAGWADDRNAYPLTVAFTEWVESLTEGLRNDRTA